MHRFKGVSVIVRSMDRPQLSRALGSIAAQTAHVDAEVLVVAACGPDHRPVPGRVGRFACRLVTTGERLDRPRAANAGLDAAAGRYVTFLDDDDEFLPNHFSTLLAKFRTDRDCELVHARSIAADTRGNPLYLYGGPFIAWRQLDHGFSQLGSAMFLGTLIDRGVRFDENLPILQDLEFFVQCAQLTTFRYVPEPVLRYYIEDGSSGTGDAANRDWERTREPLAYIRRKWAALAERLEAMPEARIERAQQLEKAGRFEEAAALLEPVRKERPLDVNALNLSAVAFIHLGKYDEAKRLLHTALDVLPGHPGLVANLQLLARLSGIDIPGV